MKTREELKTFYKGLDGLYEGYIQMSDEKLHRVFKEKSTLPSWDEIHNEINFIFEAVLFDGDRSVTIRQVNDHFSVIDKKLSDYSETTQETFATDGYPMISIIQVWDSKPDELCEEFGVLKPTLQLFAGFTGGDA